MNSTFQVIIFAALIGLGFLMLYAAAKKVMILMAAQKNIVQDPAAPAGTSTTNLPSARSLIDIFVFICAALICFWLSAKVNSYAPRTPVPVSAVNSEIQREQLIDREDTVFTPVEEDTSRADAAARAQALVDAQKETFTTLDPVETDAPAETSN